MLFKNIARLALKAANRGEEVMKKAKNPISKNPIIVHSDERKSVNWIVIPKNCITPNIDEKIKSERLATVLNLQENITYKKNKLLEGKVLDVLVEGQSETDSDKLTGRTRTNKIVNFYPVRKKNSNGVYGDNKLIGNLVNIKIFEAKQHSLYGERV